MHLGIVITSNHPETVWNAFRLADFSLTKGDKTSVFLMANGVEADSLDSEKFDITIRWSLSFQIMVSYMLVVPV